MDWVSLLIGAVGKLVEQWIVADDKEKAAIEARATEAISAMRADRLQTEKDHDDRTRETMDTLTRIANVNDTKP
jgi:hypothetical protein